MVPGLVERDRLANEVRLAAWLAAELPAQQSPRAPSQQRFRIALSLRPHIHALVGYVARSLRAWSMVRRPVKSALGK